MSKADYPYADDEFDAPLGPDVPRGVHRAPRSAWSRWWPFVVVIVVVPALAYALVTWESRDKSTDSSDDDTVATAPATTAAGKPSTSASPKPSDETSDAASDDTSDDASESATPTAEVALDTPVTVLNAAGINGLAAKTVTQLEGAGFTAAKADDFTGTKPAASTIYYATEDLAATAAKVGETLGIDAQELSGDQAGDGITVVLVTAPAG